VVLAIGNPFGVGQTVTMGIVSATGRSDLGISTFENFIQTDAAINPGNSGGALINAYGQLIGINTAIFSKTGGSQGIGFAIPVSLAQGVMQQIIEHGRVVRGWIGVEIQTMTPVLAESFDLPNEQGVVVAGVLRGGPADRAGMEPGDIITMVEGQPVASVKETLNIITFKRPAQTARVHVVRAGNELDLEVTVAERPEQAE
jgi:S1-C subfamily serine protease